MECLKKQQIILLVASEVAHWIEALACMPGDLSLLSESYKLTEENQLLRLVLGPHTCINAHTCIMACLPAHVHMHIHKYVTKLGDGSTCL